MICLAVLGMWNCSVQFTQYFFVELEDLIKVVVNGRTQPLRQSWQSGKHVYIGLDLVSLSKNPPRDITCMYEEANIANVTFFRTDELLQDLPAS